MTNGKGNCFVVMGFGTKTDFESGNKFDLDKSYRNLIKPAVIAAGYECVRADEIVHSGLIDVPMYEQLLGADIVIADLSTSNKNAFYELGIRHALRPSTTIVIAEQGLKAPFDVNHIVIRSYKHLGEDIGFDEVMRFREVLTTAITRIAAMQVADRVDSPVYRFVNGLQPPARLAAMMAAASQAAPPPPPPGGALAGTHSELMKQVDSAMDAGQFLNAKSLLGAIRTLAKSTSPEGREDPYLLQRLALATYKSESPDKRSALLEAADILKTLEPETSNYTETLGQWGAIYKRLWKLSNDMTHLDEAVRALERGFYMRNDHYNGINLAFLLNIRAAKSSEPAEAIADFIKARRVRAEVQRICESWLKANPVAPPPASADARKQQKEIRYWVMASLAEAKFGLGLPGAQAEVDATLASAPATWMANSTRAQIEELRGYLADSPLRHLKDRGS